MWCKIDNLACDVLEIEKKKKGSYTKIDKHFCTS